MAARRSAVRRLAREMADDRVLPIATWQSSMATSIIMPAPVLARVNEGGVDADAR